MYCSGDDKPHISFLIGYPVSGVLFDFLLSYFFHHLFFLCLSFTVKFRQDIMLSVASLNLHLHHSTLTVVYKRNDSQNVPSYVFL